MNSKTVKPTSNAELVADSATLKVTCLCAAWCGVCKQYASQFQALQAKYPALHWQWVDVEDDEELVGDLDIETFPTLLIGQGVVPLFFGPLLPQIQVLERLLASLQQGDSNAQTVSSEAAALWQRLMLK